MKYTPLQMTIRVLIILIINMLGTTAVQAQIVNFEETWKEFLKNEKVVNTSELPRPAENSADFPKYCLIYANTSFCANEVVEAEEYMEKIRNTGEKVYGAIPGFRKRFVDLELKMSAYYKTEELWNRFLMNHDVTFQELESAKDAIRVCEKTTLAKYTFMQTYSYYCLGDVAKAEDRFNNYVLQIVDRTSLKVSDVKGLDGELKVMRQLFKGIAELNVAWNKYMTTGKSDGFTTEIPTLACNNTPKMKAYLLEGASDICNKGEDMLDLIEELMEENPSTPDATFLKKFNEFKQEVDQNIDKELALERAWNEFLKTGDLKNKINYEADYCDKSYNIKAYVIKGSLDVCGWATPMLEKIASTRKAYNPTLDEVTEQKITALQAAIQGKKDDFDTLSSIWTQFVANNDTMTKEFELQAQYCDLIAQVRSWAVKGNFYYCDQGEHYLKLIDRFEREYSLTYDMELTCVIERLRIKVWECKRSELAMQAQFEANEKDDPNYFDKRFQQLIKEAKIGTRPKGCPQ